MKVTFFGATDTVTGSRFLVEHGRVRVLVDCGLFQGVKKLRLRNWDGLPVDPSRLDAIVLTHAHLDHSGYVPAVVRDGFTGPIWCTPLTASLAEVLLRDAAYLAVEEARHRNRHGTTRHRPALPLYDGDDAELAISRLRTATFGDPVEIAEGLTLRFTRAGHILGAACVRLSADDGTSIVFTGDVGRPDDPVMLPPEPLPAADHVVTESTYGDRLHPTEGVRDALAEVVRRTVARGGVVLVPAFAVGRAQLILHLLAELREQGRIPDVPTFLNSPMAIDVTELLLASRGEHRLDEAACRRLADSVTLVRSADESRELTRRTGPQVVVTASGMLTGGRVLHHLVRLARDPRHTIVLAGYQAAGTRGRTLQDGIDRVKVFGDYLTVRAEVVTLPALSAHADADELITWLGRTEAPDLAHIVHGEPSAADALRRRLRDDLGWRTHIPEFGETVPVLGAGGAA